MSFYEESSSSDESEQNSGDDSDYIENSSRKGGVKRKQATTASPAARKSAHKPKAPPKPTFSALRYMAKVIEMATSAATEMSKDASKLAKIRKAMELATHPGTGEAEAKVAMRMATKLMASQNITQADLIDNETAEELCEAFDVQVYSEKNDEDSLDWVFYGLADVRNTVAAAIAFEMLHNQIELWALENKRELQGRSAGNSYRIGVSERVLKDTKRASRQALKQAEENERRRQREEAAAAEVARAAEIARLAIPIDTVEERSKPNAKVEDVPDHEFLKPAVRFPTPSPDTDDDSDLDCADYGDPSAMDDVDLHWDKLDGNLRPDFEGSKDAPDDFDLDGLQEKIRIKAETEDLSLGAPQCGRHTSPTLPETKVQSNENIDPVKVKSESIDDAPSWSSALQLRTFQNNAQTIAENYLKDSGIKLRKGRKRAEIKLNPSAYSKGWDDGERVDLKRRRIEGQVYSTT
ncbi:hypothetical protein C0995_011702 [Termitomyces sp. Mi166|nr:hypothetical protein C0995_011702 [Termitomyces sp. Mi166\